MPNVYVITSVTRSADGLVYILGSVNGLSMSVSCTAAQFNTFPNTATQLTFIQGLMLAAYNQQNPTAVPGLAGTYTV